MLITFSIILVISMKVTQQVYVADDWVQSANNKLDVEIQNRHNVAGICFNLSKTHF